VIVVAAVVTAVAAVALAGATPEARQVYAPTWMTTVVDMGPCALSIVMPASEAERCAGWTRRESSGPAFHPGLGVVVTGGSDKQLRGLDATSGKKLWARPTPGAIVAQPAIDDQSAYAGTDDARVVRVDVASGRERWVAAVDAEVTEPVVVRDDAVFVVTGADSTYALSKETGEALWVHKHALPRAITLRGQGRPLPLDVRRLSIWISPRDLVQLFQIGLDHPDLRYEIFYGASDNAAGWWDNSRAHRYGYRPQDKAEDHRAHAEAEQARIGPDPVGDLFQGGSFCSAEFTNDVKRAGP
jgi:hypothetical protein